MVSIVIVNYKAGPLLRACVASLKASLRIPFEVVIVDNASDDPVLDELEGTPNVVVLRERTNWGFAKGCNIGARAARFDLIHFLNPDTTVDADLGEALVRVQEHPDRAVYVTRIDDGAGHVQGSHMLPLLVNLPRLLLRPRATIRWYIGASVVITRALYEEIGGFSEDYFMYSEDTDFFYKAYRAGLEITELPTTVTHHQGGSSRTVWSDLERLRRVEASATIFRRKYGLSFNYFLFKHLAFVKTCARAPGPAWRELRVFWGELLRPKRNTSGEAKSGGL